MLDKPASRRPRAALALTVATALTGVSNYAYGLVLTHQLTTNAYSTFAAGQAMLLLAGTLASAGVPWALARELSKTDDLAARRCATAFALRANLVLALGLGVPFAALAYGFAGGQAPLVIGCAVAAVILGSTCFGFLQGIQAFGSLAVVITGEVAVKIAIGLGLVGLGGGASGALFGAVVGGAVVAAYGLFAIRKRLGRLPRMAGLGSRALWPSTLGMLLVQGAVAVFATSDTVLVATLGPTHAQASVYQVAATIGRMPLYLSVAVSTALFPGLVGRKSAAQTRQSSVATLLRILVPAYFVLAFVPWPVLHLVLPASYSHVGGLLPITAASGVALAFVNLFTTFFQAQARFRQCIRVLAVAAVADVAAVILGGYFARIRGLAFAEMASALVCATLLVMLAWTTFGDRPVVAARPLLRWAAPAVPLPWLAHYPVVWTVWLLVVLVDVAWGLHRPPTAPSTDPATRTEPRRPSPVPQESK